MNTATAPASLPVIKALLDEAAQKRFTGGVLGVRARPEWSDATDFEHNGVAVRVVVCLSALAVREALTERAPDAGGAHRPRREGARGSGSPPT